MPKHTELLPGTLDLLILRTLALGPLHGVGVADRLAQVTRGAFRVGPGSLFTALHRMQGKGWLSAAWGETSEGHRAKFYQVTPSGHQRLGRETARWRTIAWAMDQALAAGEAKP